MSGAYYNEIDPYAAEWLRRLIIAGVIAPGEVDDRSIEDVRPDDLRGFTQCHFFAGIGVWSMALRGVGWPDDAPIWSMSCPCQPFSSAGKGDGFVDERHLWPAAFHLITQLGPERIVGEQVASPDGLAWIDLVQADLEGAGYATGALDTCSAGFGAPHLRQRLYWDGVALGDTPYARLERHVGHGLGLDGRPGPAGRTAATGHAGHMADAGRTGLQFEHRPGEALGASGAAEREARERQRGGLDAGGSGPLGHMADTHGWLARHEREQRGGEYGQLPADGGTLGMANAPGSGGGAGLRHFGEDEQRRSVAPDRRSTGDLANPASGGRGVQRLTSEPGHSGHLDGGYAAYGVGDPASLYAAQERAGAHPLNEQWATNGRRPVQPLGAGATGGSGGGLDRAGGTGIWPPGDLASMARPGPVNGAWGTADWLLCTDGKWRPVEPGTFPLAHGAPARSGRLRAYGNAINLEAAKGFLSVALAT